MDCHNNHRYQPYASPSTFNHSERYLEKRWLSHGDSQCPSMSGGILSDRFASVNRGVRNPTQFRRLPGTFQGRPHEGHCESRLKIQQYRLSPDWFPGAQSLTHCSAASMSRTSTKESLPSDIAPLSIKSSAPSVELKDALVTTTCSIAVQSSDKLPAASDSKNPVVKIAPFSHQPLSNRSKPKTSSSPPTSADSNRYTSGRVKPEDRTTLDCGQLTAISSSQNDHEGPSVVAVFAQKEDSHFRPIPVAGVAKTICSCQLRRRVTKYYGDKGKSNEDPIVIDSDEEGEKSDAQGKPVNISDNQDGETNSTARSTTCFKAKQSSQTEQCVQDSPRKRAKMSTEIGSTLSQVQSSDLVVPVGKDISNQVTESVAGMASMIADRLRQSGSESSSSAASSDSLSTVASTKITEEAPLLANPQILRGMLNECDQTARPPKKFKISTRNLFTAAKACNIHKVLSLLVEGCDPNLQVASAKGKTAMHAAASGGYVDIMASLRLAGCDLNLMDFENRTPLFDAVRSHKVKAVEYLIECGAVLTGKDIHGMTCFHLATRQGHTDLISLLLNTGRFDINQKDDGGWTPIMWAAEDKNADATRLLVEKGANVHHRDLELNVPLHWAALSGNLEVCKLLLDEHTGINSMNKRDDTPLHIAAREDNYACVQLLISRGADIHIKNKEGFTPFQIAPFDSRTRHLLESKRILQSCQEHVRSRVLHSDISRGQENVSISCINEVDDEPFPQFHFVKECCEIGGETIRRNITRLQGCKCVESCRSGKACSCSERSDGQRIWYNQDGLLVGEIQKFDRPLLYECNRMCNCWTYCKNRLVQKGMQYPLQLYRTRNKGWGVRSLAVIPQGSFVCEYTGELISDMEADARDDDSYLFDLDCKESCYELYCIDGKNYGNISRFINHSCEPNIFPIRVFIDHQHIQFPRIAFFAAEEINHHDEICFDYGDRFWSVKKKEFYCECNTPSCKYRDPTS